MQQKRADMGQHVEKLQGIAADIKDLEKCDAHKQNSKKAL